MYVIVNSSNYVLGQRLKQCLHNIHIFCLKIHA